MPLRRIAIVVAAVLVLPACIASETQSEGPALSERLQQSDCEGPKPL